ncbi:MAG: hypothetical protein KTR32_09560, partial [Granulosicoccus sp.]|nr:hypothetical protein [Granulosicoccus sp.]
MSIQIPLFLLTFLWVLNVLAAPGGNGVIPQERWYDSYSANGKCYIDSGLGKGMGDVVVPTPVGGQTLSQVAARLGPGPGRGANPIYNDVQCGHGPASKARNEAYDQCPGRVDQGAAGCSVIGPKWDLETAYSSTPTSSEAPLSESSGEDCNATGFTLKQARAKYANNCATWDRKDCDRIYLDDKLVWMCASFRIGEGAPTTESGSNNTVLSGESASSDTNAVTQSAQQVVEITGTETAATQEQNSVPNNAQTEARTEVQSTAATVLMEGDCNAVGDDLINARNAYANKCAAERIDCDPTGNGKEYRCASYRMPRGSTATSPVIAAAAPEVTVVELSSTSEETSEETTTPTTESVPAAVQQSSERCSATGSSLQLAKNAYASSCSLKRVDCDPAGNGGYICASYAMGGSGAQSAATSATTSTSTASNAQEVLVLASGGSVSSVRVEAETRSGSGWVNRGGYIEFTGSNAYSSPTHGVLTYQIDIPVAGQWEMRWRAKAAKKTSGRNDLHNDAWAKMNGSRVSGFHDVRSFRKVYSSGSGNWQVAGTVEVGQHNFTKFRQQFDQGRYQFELSGRSNGYAIDYIEFVRVGGGTTTSVATSASTSSSSSSSSSNNKYVDG